MAEQTIQVLTPGQVEAATEARSEAEQWLDEVRSVEVRSDADAETVADLLRMIKSKHDEIESQRKTITGPLNKAKRAVDDLFRPPRKALEAAREHLREELARYQAEIEERNRLAKEEAKEAALAQDPSAAHAALQRVQDPAPVQGVHYRETWEAVGWDREQVPRQYLTLDIERIKLEARAYKDSPEPPSIPGVQWERKRIPVVR